MQVSIFLKLYECCKRFIWKSGHFICNTICLRDVQVDSLFIIKSYLVHQYLRVAQWSESIGLKDLMVLESGVRIPLWDVGAGLSDETV
jgi:hypothetical protein